MNKVPLRVIKGNARPFEPFWNFVDAASSESGEVELEFFGPISEYSWSEDGISPQRLSDDLKEKGAGRPIRLKINSPGGEAFAAQAIRSILRDYTGKVTADIIGLAASAATIVVTGADFIEMRQGAMIMVHDPWTCICGSAEEMRKNADVLDSIKESILAIYQKRTQKSHDELSKMMTDETWLTADQAKEAGFVDVVTDGYKSQARNSIPKNSRVGFLNCLRGYQHLPDEIKNEYLANDQDPITENEAGKKDSNVPVEKPSSGPEPVANALEVKRLGDFLEVFG